MPRSTRALVASFLLVASAAACGSRAASAPDSTALPPASGSAFPTAEELGSLAAGAPVKPPNPGLEVARWDLEGPFPDAIEPRAEVPPAPWAALLEGARDGAAVTQDMTCVARELGRFYLEHGEPASETLRRAVAGWCGVAAVDVDVRLLGGDAPQGTGDDAIFAAWRAKAAPLVAGATAGERYVGLWFGRAAGRAVLAVASGEPRVQLERTPLAPDANGQVALAGQLLEPAGELRVRVNRGRLGVADCDLDVAVALPRFRARCAVDPGDATTWIEASAVPPHHLLGKAVLRVLARRAGAEPSLGTGVLAAAPAGADDSVVGRVNLARHDAGLAPLVVALRESKVAQELVPAYFADGGAGSKADRIALGLMAGWDVDAMVVGAGVYSAAVRSDDAQQLVAACLDSPAGRAVLLDPQATHVAVAALGGSAPTATAGLFVTYRTLADAPGDDAARAFARVSEARTARGLAAPRALPGLDDELARLGREVRAGELTPDDAESHLLAHALRTSGLTGLHGAVVVTSDLTHATLPEEVFAPGGLALAAFAVPYRPAGDPWWRWALVVVTGPGEP